VRKILFLFILLAVGACGLKEKEIKVPQEEVGKVAAIGEKATKKLMAELKSNLGKAIREGGMPGAIEFCAGKAQELAQKVNRELVVVRVSRVSDKYRNPKNKPDSLDMKVIRMFKEKLRKGSLPPYYVTAVERGGKLYYVYYKPIRVAPFCLQCHGNPEEMDPEVLKVLREKYPEDKALNYKAGDLRGVFKVVIPADKI